MSKTLRTEPLEKELSKRQSKELKLDQDFHLLNNNFCTRVKWYKNLLNELLAPFTFSKKYVEKKISQSKMYHRYRSQKQSR